MAKRPANPNTAYGRKRLREENQQWKAKLSPEERSKAESFSFGWTIVIIAIIILIVFLIGGSNGLMKWISK